jgi:hypothetical protein
VSARKPVAAALAAQNIAVVDRTAAASTHNRVTPHRIVTNKSVLVLVEIAAVAERCTVSQFVHTIFKLTSGCWCTNTFDIKPNGCAPAK